MTKRTPISIAVIVTLGLMALPPFGGSETSSRPASSEDFFIIASVNAKRNELVLKLPTEVTQLMRVTDKTIYQAKDGKPLKFADFRAGDTVYISYERGGDAVAVAKSIRKGPMTV